MGASVNGKEKKRQMEKRKGEQPVKKNKGI